MPAPTARKTVTRIAGIGLLAASVTGIAATAATAAPLEAAPASSTTAPATNLDRVNRVIDGATSQVLVDGQLVKVNTAKSSWMSKDPIFKIRPYAQEDITLSGTDAHGKKVSFQLTFNKTDIGPQVKLVKVNGQRDDARIHAQTVKFVAVSDATDLAQVNLLTDGGHTLQFNLLAHR